MGCGKSQGVRDEVPAWLRKHTKFNRDVHIYGMFRERMPVFFFVVTLFLRIVYSISTLFSIISVDLHQDKINPNAHANCACSDQLPRMHSPVRTSAPYLRRMDTLFRASVIFTREQCVLLVCLFSCTPRPV